MSVQIHPTAIVADGAVIEPGCVIGPYCVIGPHVRIGPRCELVSHVVIDGRTTIGADNRFFPFCAIGQPPQDLKYRGEPSEIVIGDGNIFREYVTVHPGTEEGGMITRIGSRNLFMASSHVAHDCQLGDGIVMANSAALGGHVTVQDRAILGGLVGVHQFCRVGRLAMVAGLSGVNLDVPPFCLVAGGYRPRVVGLNLVGLKRAGLAPETIAKLRKLLPLLLRPGAQRQARLQQAKELAAGCAEAEELVSFVEQSERGVLKLAD